MVTDGILSFVIFLYADEGIQWTTGGGGISDGVDGLGGSPAQVGFNAGDGIRSYSVPESQTRAVINISMTSNVGVPGVWIFQVNGENIRSPISGMYLKLGVFKMQEFTDESSMGGFTYTCMIE